MTMLRRTCKLLSTVLVLALALSILALPASASFVATKVLISGEELTAKPPVRRIEGVTYVPLRGFITALAPEAEFSWSDEKETATVTLSGLELKVPQNEPYIIANGRYLYLGGSVRNENGSLMLPIRPLAKAFGVEVEWDEERETVIVTGEVNPIAPGWSFYNDENLYWLSRIVYSEAGVESLEGQIAVAQVVLNRKACCLWPNTIYGVIFDDRAGVQFSPTANGTIYQEPSAESVIAAKLALDGADVIGDCCYFLNPDISDDGWFERNCEYATTIGSHKFYSGGLW
ncbi:MAG: cell wall hydrolase [Oscillospiraceae bacterium]|nr:cell wall hydrolase [Oscillospiraceae bacterium]